ncbi:MerR family transcriptional regulator [Streptomyces paromomycinus]|uniref:MerR family transcriptional regulator n=1 Tax=Streptomyces paromomycinus TaxID=92743 RepID=A0A401VWY2_STREY|nr:MerR family transcriptional regulator [Streptomyces paromomycinus]GCD41590.1 MerR family transcriptional regulator [Streptomyces paromomycinus]
MADGLTIGQAAAFVGVTVKTVRHYHRLGLVAEPERDSSGYRRYGSADLLRLIQARTLAGAGVPLAEIADLLDAGPERFATALDDVHRRLTERIEDLTARRDTLHRLTHGDRVLLPDRACAVLDRLAGLGFRPDYVAAQREALVLARALVPEIVDSFLTRLELLLDDPEHVELTRRGWDARSWEPDDPRIEELASALTDKLLADRARLTMPAGFGKQTDAAARYRLVNRHGEDQAPSIARLNTLIEANLRAAGVDVPRQ